MESTLLTSAAAGCGRAMSCMCCVACPQTVSCPRPGAAHAAIRSCRFCRLIAGHGRRHCRDAQIEACSAMHVRLLASLAHGCKGLLPRTSCCQLTLSRSPVGVVIPNADQGNRLLVPAWRVDPQPAGTVRGAVAPLLALGALVGRLRKATPDQGGEGRPTKGRPGCRKAAGHSQQERRRT